MIVQSAILIAALASSPGFAQFQSGISGLNAPGPGTGSFSESISGWNRGADSKEWKQRRLARLKTILAANPEAERRLQAMTDPKAKAAYLSKLDRATPGYGGRY